MSSTRALLPALVLSAAFLGFKVAAADRPAPDEAVRVRALLVGDTGDPDIGGSVQKDLRTVQGLLEGAFRDHKDHLSLSLLMDRDVTRERILGHYDQLAGVANETLLFYFSGHGATDRRRGPFFQVLASDSFRLVPLARDEVRSAMRSHRPRLCILLSDVCSDVIDLGPRERAAARPPDWATIRCLFLQARGLVDANAVSEGESAIGLEDGGFFTLSLADRLRRPFKELDRDGDGFLHWQELLPEVQTMAQKKYAGWREQVLPQVTRQLAAAETKGEEAELSHYRNQLEKQPAQTVRVYSLPSLNRFGVRVVEHGGEGVEVLVVHGDTPADLAGLKPGDVLLEIGGKAINSLPEFTEAVAHAKGSVPVAYRRPGQTEAGRVEVRLPSWPAPGADG
jgi:hypothetical protein